MPMIRNLMQQADLQLEQLDAIAYGRGPGAFTGVRIATGVAQGLAYALGKPLIPISSLATLAQSLAGEQSHIVAAFDARIGEIYCGFYQTHASGRVVGVTAETVCLPEDILIPGEATWHGIGSGWQTYSERLLDCFSQNCSGFLGPAWPSAEYMLPLALHEFELGNIISAEQAMPVYLRNKVTG